MPEQRFAQQRPGPVTDPVLVMIYLRGGQDQLNTIVPYTDKTYYKIRPTISIPAEEVVRLPGEVRFGEGAPAEIRFAPDGSLDRALHKEPVRIPLEYADGRRRELLVGLYGTVE